MKMIEEAERAEPCSYGHYEDDKIALSFECERHKPQPKETNVISQSWRIRDRMKTVSVALVVCLNVGVDPPDVVKTQPCARLESWIDPSSVSPQKALELIGQSLQKQYERWQPRARYKQSLDPTVEDVKKLCTSLRRNAKEERVLFHYNGHGVPRPTANGEIWVFNRNYTQYIPLSIYDLQTWMGAPSIYVYDCSNAGIIVNSFNQFADQHEREIEQMSNSQQSPNTFKNCIQLASCSSNQILPMNPQLPADLFTSCLTTPIKIALKWFTLQQTSRLAPKVTYELIEKIPGQLNDRRTMMGELNWIFTAITDTIAWNILPRDTFQKLFRQDLLVASLFRNYLLADRIMRSYDCTPISSPPLPNGYRHPMWAAWDLSVELALQQLPDILEKNIPYKNSPFFEDQLTAFHVWLERGCESRSPPEQLPIVLQVLLSQVHRLRALELLGRFLNLGPWAVNLALSVGIFPYVLKLLQSSARELRPLLVFIWAKILAVDGTCQVDLVRENGHKYFLSVLQDTDISAHYRTLAAFVLASIVNNFPLGQATALQGSLVSICLVQICDSNPLLRQWLVICLGNLWQNYDKARWSGVRDLAHEKLFPLLQDSVPEVRAAAVYALGTFISSVTQRSEHANNIDRSIAMTLLRVANDMSPMVRKELVAALQWMVILFETQFVSIHCSEIYPPRPNNNSNSLDRTINLKRVSSSSSIHNMPSTYVPPSLISFGSIYAKLWQGLLQLSKDTHPEVADMAKILVEHIKNQVNFQIGKEVTNDKSVSSLSLPPSPNTRINYLSESPPAMNSSISGKDWPNITCSTTTIKKRDRLSVLSKNIHNGTHDFDSSHTSQRCATPPSESGQRKHHREHRDETDASAIAVHVSTPSASLLPPLPCSDIQQRQMVHTNYIASSIRHFSTPTNKKEPSQDRHSAVHLQRIWRFKRNDESRRVAREQQKRAIFSRLDTQSYVCRTQSMPNIVKLHPFEQQIAVAYMDRVRVNDWSRETLMSFIPTSTSQMNRVSSIEFLNAHDHTLVLTGYYDGGVRVWREKNSEDSILLTAWQALPEGHTPKSKHYVGLLTSWHQKSHCLVVGGDSKFLRCWDVNRELNLCDLPTDSDSFVCVLSSAPNELIAAGCGDGSVRLFDKRLPPNDARVMTYREHRGAILAACIRDDCLVSGCSQGSVRLFDVRHNSSIQHWDAGDITTMAVHSSADIVACGTNGITIYGLDGRQLNVIKTHEGFMGHKVGYTSCLSFHPHKVSLAAGFVDNTVAVYVTDTKRHS